MSYTLNNYWSLSNNASLLEQEQLINLWKIIYKGKQDWLEYKYAGIDGKRHKRIMKTFNPAKVICTEITNLIWSELPIINIDDEIIDILYKNNFIIKMKEFTEKITSLGGGALKIYSENNEIKIDFVTADRFIPISWDNKIIYEADFIERKVINNEIYVRIEKHRKAYDEDDTHIGYNITNHYFDKNNKSVSKIKAGFDVEDELFIPSTYPLFSYIKCSGSNNLVDNSPLGIALFANSIDTLKSIDTTFDALVQEVILGKKRIIVSADAVKVVYDKDGNEQRYFDNSDEVYQAFSTEDKENLKIVDNTVDLRIEKLRLSLATMLDLLSIQVGLSQGSISLDDGSSVKTATEIISENSRTFKTKQSIENEIGVGMINLFKSITYLLESLGLGNFPNKDTYIVKFQDNIIEDRNTKTDYWLKRYNTGTCELEDVFINVDGLTEEQAKEKAAKIEGKKVNESTDFFGDTE